MIQEIEVAANFLARFAKNDSGGGVGQKNGSLKSLNNIINNSNGLNNGNSNTTSSNNSNGNKCSTVTDEKLQEFVRCLSNILQNRFRNHWFPERPLKAQGYRSIRINRYNRVDPIINQACKECGIKYSELKLPQEFTIWIDPNEVACRIGEHVNTQCIIAKFSDGRTENYVNLIDIDELEAQSNMQLKMNHYDIMNSRQKSKQAMLARNAAANAAAAAAGRTPHSTPSSVYRNQHVNGLANGSSPVARMGATSSPHVPVTSAASQHLANGYVDYTNGNLMPATSSSVVTMQQQQQQQQYGAHHAFNGQTNGGPHGFFAGSPGPHFHQMAAAAAQSATAFGSPNGNHLYQKFNHLGMSSPHSTMSNGRTLNGNGVSMSPSGMLRSTNTHTEKHVVLNSYTRPSPPDSTGSGNCSPPYVVSPPATSPILQRFGANYGYYMPLMMVRQSGWANI